MRDLKRFGNNSSGAGWYSSMVHWPQFWGPSYWDS